jgi:hypothetical protein
LVQFLSVYTQKVPDGCAGKGTKKRGASGRMEGCHKRSGGAKVLCHQIKGTAFELRSKALTWAAKSFKVLGIRLPDVIKLRESKCLSNVYKRSKR